MGAVISKHPTAIKGTMNKAKISFGTEKFAGAVLKVVQSLELRQYVT
jgi:hypothetical protein